MKKAITLLLTMAMVSTMFAACGGTSSSSSSAGGSTAGGSSSSSAAAGGTGAKVELSVSTWDYTNTAYQKTQVEAYQAAHPELTVKILEAPAAEYDDKIQIMLSGGDKVDVVFTKGTPALSGLISKNQVLPLDDYITKANVDKAKYSGLIEELVVDGKTYAMPYRKDNNLLYYNKDLFDKAGVEYPKDGMTMAEYRELAKKMTSGEGAEKVYGAHIHTWAGNVNVFARRDGVYDPWGEDKSVLKPYYEAILGMQNEDKTVQDYAALKAGSVHYSGVFYNQRVSMMQMGTWYINMLVEQKAKGVVNFNWGVCSIPTEKGVSAKAGIGGVTPVSINAKAEHPDQAWDFVSFVTGEEGATILAKSGIFPGYTSDAVIAEFAKLDGVPSNITDYLNVDSIIIEQPMNMKGREADKIITEEHDLIMVGGIDLDAGLAEMTKRVNDALKG